MIEIRRCRAGEIEEVMAFIGAHWRPGHVLATHRGLMDWQHGEADGDHNFLLAWVEGELAGVLGYIPSRRFDPALAAEHNCLWLALWKVDERKRVAGLGLRLLNALTVVEPNAGLAVNGLNPDHRPLYAALGWHVAELRQYYVVSPTAPRRLIAAPADWSPPTPRAGRAALLELGPDQLEALAERTPGAFGTSEPVKTPRAFAARFCAHPFYRYRVFLVSAEGCGPALIATRLARHADAAALRVVDFAGDEAALGHCGDAIAALLAETGAEYADFCQHGLAPSLLAGAGFTPLDPEGPVTVPTYFEPFVPRNARSWCAVRLRHPRGATVVCRADGDQDRPNLLPAHSRPEEAA